MGVEKVNDCRGIRVGLRQKLGRCDSAILKSIHEILHSQQTKENKQQCQNALGNMAVSSVLFAALQDNFTESSAEHCVGALINAKKYRWKWLPLLLPDY